jgi:hypothetical protein
VIIDPGLPDHWKLHALEKASGREDAIKFLIRLWGNCQQRRNDRFNNNPVKIAAICCFDGDPKQFVQLLLDLDFLERDGAELVVHQWSEYNASLISNWEKGKKGGRPKTPGKPQVNPEPTPGKPIEGGREGIEGIEGKKEGSSASHSPDGADLPAGQAGASDLDPLRSLKEQFPGIDVEAQYQACRAKIGKEPSANFFKGWLKQIIAPPKPKQKGPRIPKPWES